MRRLLAIIVSPLAGCFCIAIIFFLFVDSNKTISLEDRVGIYAYLYFISLIIQISLVESCLYIYSAFREVCLITYLGLAVIYCLAFTILFTQITILEPDEQSPLFEPNIFGFFVAYSLANIFCYYHLYFKHEVNEHENV